MEKTRTLVRKLSVKSAFGIPCRQMDCREQVGTIQGCGQSLCPDVSPCSIYLSVLPQCVCLCVNLSRLSDSLT